MKKLPDAEFEVMKVVWANEAPITTSIIMEQLGNKKKWRASTAITLLSRLIDRGFLWTEKNSKERSYFPLVRKEDYLRFETNNFMKLYHESSFASFVTALHSEKKISEKDIDELQKIIKEWRG